MTNKKSAKTTEKPTQKKKDLMDYAKNRRKEWRLDLPLPAVVEGDLPAGKKFKENTILENISARGAYFCLDSGITVGSKLNLCIDLPENLTEGKKVRLCLGGLTVRLEKKNKKGKKQGVALCFDKKYTFIDKKEKK